MKWMKLEEKKFNKTNLIKALREAKHSVMAKEDKQEIARFIRLIQESYGRKSWQDELDETAYVFERIMSYTYGRVTVNGQHMGAMFEIIGWILDSFEWKIDSYTIEYYKEMRKWNLV